MGSLIIVLTALAVYYSEVYCDTLPTKIAKPEDTVVLRAKNNHSHVHDVTIERGGFWKNLSLSRYKPTKAEEPRNPDGTNGEANKRKGRFLNSLAFLTGLSFGGLATAASSTMKTIAKIPQVFSINLGSSKTSPFFTAYYSQYPYSPLLPYPFFYPNPVGLAPMSDTAKPQTGSQNDLTSHVINLFDNRPVDLADSNEDYADAEKPDGADDRTGLRIAADRNTEEKSTTRGCKENQRKHVKGTAREREYIQVSAADLRAALDLKQSENQTGMANVTTTTPPSNNTNTTHHHHHHHHHHGGYGKPHFPGYYGGYPQNIHHVDFTTTQPYSQISYNTPYEQPVNFYHDDKYNAYPGFNPSYSAPFLPDQTNEYVGTDFNQLYPSYQLPNISDGFRPLK